MERFKNSLILEMTGLRERISNNLGLILFLLRNDHVYSSECWSLIKALHEWPYLLSQVSEEAEERHKAERSEIETQLIKRKDEFENEIMAFDETVQQVAKWGDLYGYR